MKHLKKFEGFMNEDEDNLEYAIRTVDSELSDQGIVFDIEEDIDYFVNKVMIITHNKFDRENFIREIRDFYNL